MAGTGSRTLKLAILGDIDNLKKNLTDGSKDVEGFGDITEDVARELAAMARAGHDFTVAKRVLSAVDEDAALRFLEE